MWPFFAWFFVFKGRRPTPRPLRIGLVLFAVGLVIVVLMYTVNLFLTLPERTSGHHVQHNSSH